MTQAWVTTGQSGNRKTAMSLGFARTTALISAAVLGLMTIGLAYVWMMRSRQSAGRRVPVVVAAQYIPARTIISPEMVHIESISASDVQPDSTFTTTQVKDRVSVLPVRIGEQLCLGNLMDKASMFGLTAVIPAGTRAMTIPIDPNDMVPGFLQPGQRVDVVASFTSGSDSVAKTILQNVPLLAVNANLAPVSSDQARKSAEASKSGGASTQTSAQPTVTLVTIAITPFEAERLVAAGQKGKLKIGLRGIGDDSRVETRGAGTNALMGIPAEPVRPTTLYRAPPVRPRRPYSKTTYLPPLLPILPPQAGGEPARRMIRVIKGSKVENVEVDR